MTAFSSYKSPGFFLIFFFMCILLVTMRLHSLSVQKNVVPCENLGVKIAQGEEKDVTCFQNLFFGQLAWNSMITDPSLSQVPLTLEISVQKMDSHKIYGQSVRSPNFIKFLNPFDSSRVAQSSAVGTTWSAAVRELFDFSNYHDPTILFTQAAGEKAYELSWLSSDVSTKWILNGMTLVLGGLLIFMLIKARTSQQIVTVLAGAFTILLIYCGMPFGSAAGWYDTGDDRSYVHWALQLGYQLDPFLYHNSWDTYAQRWNHHPWGTGLLLAPFLLPIRILRPGMQLGSLHMAAMSFGIIFLSFLSVLILFLAFKRILPPRVSAVCAFATIPSTSLIKWVFMRNIFTHGPEAFTLAIATYGFVGRYFTKTEKRSDLWAIIFGLFFATQVRRENIVFLGLAMLFEVLLRDRDPLKERIKSLATLVVTGVAAHFILQGTNYFTDLKTWGPGPIFIDFRFAQFPEMIRKSAADVLFSKLYGFFYWTHGYVWVALGALWFGRKHWRIWAPMIGVFGFYCLMLMVHSGPSGGDWQGRYLLKFNPIVFGACAYFLTQASGALLVLGWGVLVVTAVYETYLYLGQIWPGMNYYSETLNDGAWLYPQVFPGLSMNLFFVPVIFFICLTGALVLVNAIGLKCPRALGLRGPAA